MDTVLVVYKVYEDCFSYMAEEYFKGYDGIFTESCYLNPSIPLKDIPLEDRDKIKYGQITK